MEMQSASIILNSRGQDHLVTLAKVILKHLLSKSTRPSCIANHYFCTVTLCQQKIGKFTGKTNFQNFTGIKVSGLREAMKT